MSSDSLIVVGAGECGTRAAFALREAGWAGPVKLIGDEPLNPYERPPLSKSAISVPAPLAPKTICDAAALRDADIDFLAGNSATAIHRATHRLELADGRILRYSRLLLATGANARRLKLAGTASVSVRYLRSYADSSALRKRLWRGARICVIGAGFIGLEVAASARARGCEVTVVEVASYPMNRIVPKAIARVVADRHAEAGVKIYCSTGVEEISARDDSFLVHLSNDNILEFDTVVAGVGAIPEITLAEKAGLSIDNGIRVDEFLATSDPDIFAAGDCCSFPHPLYGNRRIRLESWRNAVDQGIFVARSMLGAGKPFRTVPWFWSDQHDLSLQIAGLPGLAVTNVVRRRRDGVDIIFGLGSDGRLLSASAVGTGNVVAKDIRLAEFLIEQRVTPDRARLTDPRASLRAFANQT